MSHCKIIFEIHVINAIGMQDPITFSIQLGHFTLLTLSLQVERV